MKKGYLFTLFFVVNVNAMESDHETNSDPDMPLGFVEVNGQRIPASDLYSAIKGSSIVLEQKEDGTVHVQQVNFLDEEFDIYVTG